MKILTKTITAYSFNELDEFTREDAKTCILERERLLEFFTEDIKETLKSDFGLFHLNTYYSLSSCQGDGLCLYGKITFHELFDNVKFKQIAFKGIHHKQIQSVYDELQNIDFTHKSRYYHANSVSIEEDIYNPTDKQMSIIEKIVANVKSWYFTFCREWEKRGYVFFYEISDELTEIISVENDYLFTKKGKLINRNEYLELSA